jgi:hypothetical protein
MTNGLGCKLNANFNSLLLWSINVFMSFVIWWFCSCYVAWQFKVDEAANDHIFLLFPGCNPLPSYLLYKLNEVETRNSGPFYTRSPGQCSTQIKHSYWCSSWNWLPRAFTLGIKGEIEKIFFNPSQATNKCWIIMYGLVLAPKAEKRIPLNLGRQFEGQCEPAPSLVPSPSWVRPHRWSFTLGMGYL